VCFDVRRTRHTFDAAQSTLRYELRRFLTTRIGTWRIFIVEAIHGVDLAAPMPDGSPSKLVIDSGRVTALAK
jgi:hypothetical protein